MKNIVVALRVLIIMSILLGGVYPFVITGVAQIAFPYKANGSLVIQNGRPAGSELIGQTFTRDTYFHGRPSAVNYDAGNSGGSNEGPVNRKLLDRIGQRVREIRLENGLKPADPIPADLATTSSSGLDPHIKYQSALLQVPRVARARHIDEERVRTLIDKNKEYRFLVIRYDPYINVLKLNLELDRINP